MLGTGAILSVLFRVSLCGGKKPWSVVRSRKLEYASMNPAIISTIFYWHVQEKYSLTMNYDTLEYTK